MTAPRGKPSYVQAIYDPDKELPPEEEGPRVIDELLTAATWFPDWLLDGPDVELRLEADRSTGSIRFDAGSVDGVLRLTLDVSGWVLARVEVDGVERFRGYLDRPYEEYEVWPAGARIRRDAEPPGRIGKHQSWVSLSVLAWPELADIAGGDWLNLQVDDSKVPDDG